MSWTDERIELLKNLWAEGLTASQIADELGGVTRNAVIGKVHRLGLHRPERRHTALRACKPRAANAQEIKPAPAPAPAPSLPRALPPLPFTPSAPSVSPANDKPRHQRPGATGAVMALRRDDCRFPFGDPRAADFKFCCSPIVAGSYCADHRLVAFDRVSTARANRRTPKPSFKGIYT